MTSGVELALLRAVDSELLFEWINDRDLVVLSAPFRTISRAEHDSWFDDIRSRDDVRIFGIRLRDDDRLVGSCQLHSIHPVNRSGELQIRVGAVDAQDRGVGTAAVQLLLRYAFEELALHRIELRVFATNARARHVYERAGFSVEGVQREAVFVEGAWVDVVLMAMLDSEFEFALWRLAAIHQPTFLPWLGWWDKLVRADVFILLDDVQFPKKGGTWMNRVRMLVGGEARWITVPVDRSFEGTRSVREMRVDDSKPWRENVVATIRGSYARAPHAGEVLPVVEEALNVPCEGICELNERGIRLFAERLGLDASKLVCQSELEVPEATGTELLLELCRAAGGDAYLSGDGAGGYLSEEAFAAAGLGLRYQEFSPPSYPQPVDTSVPGLSVVDALMNCGWEGTAGLLSGPPQRLRRT